MSDSGGFRFLFEDAPKWVERPGRKACSCLQDVVRFNVGVVSKQGGGPQNDFGAQFPFRQSHVVAKTLASGSNAFLSKDPCVVPSRANKPLKRLEILAYCLFVEQGAYTQ